MDAIILSKEQYDEILKKFDEINFRIQSAIAVPGETFVDNQQFLQLMKISKRTAQSWRDDGIISFSQVGSKIYYRMSDVQKLLDSNYSQAFKKRK